MLLTLIFTLVSFQVICGYFSYHSNLLHVHMLYTDVFKCFALCTQVQQVWTPALQQVVVQYSYNGTVELIPSFS